MAPSGGTIQRTTAKAFKAKHHNRVTITGKLSPVTAAGEQVRVSHRKPDTSNWQTQLVNVASNGAFRVTIKSRGPGAGSSQ